MNIAVIAANGRSGEAFVRAALDAGHHVRAGVHGNHSFTPLASLEIVSCDATNAQEVERLIAGQDAVVSLIGHTPHSPATVQTDAMKVVTEVMKEQGISRIVSLTGTGVRMPGDRIPLADRLSTLVVRLFDSNRLKDGIHHVAVLQQSELDWTVIRVMKLQNVPPRSYVLTPHGPTKLYVGRQEVAQAILEVLVNRSFVQQAPMISRI